MKYMSIILPFLCLVTACNNREQPAAPPEDKNEVVHQMEDKYQVLYAAFDEGNKLHKVIFSDKDTSYFCTFCEDSTKFNKEVILKSVESRDALMQQYLVLSGRDSGGYLYVNKETQKMEFVNKSGKKQYSLDLLKEFRPPLK